MCLIVQLCGFGLKIIESLCYRIFEFFQFWLLVYLNNEMHRSALFILPIENIGTYSIISLWPFIVTSYKMRNKKRKVCPLRINWLLNELKNGEKLFVLDDSICKLIAKKVKIPHKKVKECVKDHQPFVRVEQMNFSLELVNQNVLENPNVARNEIIPQGN